jgi:hypothetical protein
MRCHHVNSFLRSQLWFSKQEGGGFTCRQGLGSFFLASWGAPKDSMHEVTKKTKR